VVGQRIVCGNCRQAFDAEWELGLREAKPRFWMLALFDPSLQGVWLLEIIKKWRGGYDECRIGCRRYLSDKIVVSRVNAGGN